MLGPKDARSSWEKFTEKTWWAISFCSPFQFKTSKAAKKS